MVFSAALRVATLVCASCFPLMEAAPAEVESLPFVLGADPADNPLVFLVDALAEGLAPRALLDPHGLLEVVFRDFRLKFFLLVSAEHTKTPHFDVAPLLIAAYGVRMVNVWTEEDEFPRREQTLTVGGQRFGRNCMATGHFGSFSFGVIIPCDHIGLICQVH